MNEKILKRKEYEGKNSAKGNFLVKILEILGRHVLKNLTNVLET